MAATACGEIHSRPMLDKHAHGFMAISENGLVECGFPAQWGLGVYRCTQRQQMFQQRYVSCRRRKRQRSPFIKPVVIDVGTVINERSYHLQMIAPAGGHNRWLIKFTATAIDINPFADKPRESSHITFLDSLPYESAHFLSASWSFLSFKYTCYWLCCRNMADIPPYSLFFAYFPLDIHSY